MIFVTFLIAGLLAATRADLNENDLEQKLPDFIKICHQSDPNLNECIKESVEIIKPFLLKGIPELNIPPCEPLVIPEIIMNQGRGAVTVQSKYTDVQIHGATNFELQQIKVDLDKNRVKIKLKLPKLEMKGNYTISGKILMLPILGNGISEGNYTDIEAIAVLQGEKFQRNGKTYIRAKDCYIDFTVKHAAIHLSNLFDGDKQLGASMNDFLNDNWKNVAEEMKPVLEKTIADLFKKFSNKIYNKYPFDMLLPP